MQSAGGQEAASKAVLAGTGPGLAASGVGKGCTESSPFRVYPSSLWVTLWAICTDGVYTRGIGSTDNLLQGVQILPGLQWGLIMRASC